MGDLRYFKFTPENDELDRFMKTVEEYGNLQNRVFFELMSRYGLRVSEAVNLRVSDLTPRKNPQILEVKRLKGSVSRPYPLFGEGDEAFKRVLTRYLESLNGMRGGWLFPSKERKGKPITKSTAQKRFQRLCQKANLYHLGSNIHSLRHTTGARLAWKGMDIEFIRKFLGHKNISNTAIYCELFPRDWLTQAKEGLKK